MLNCSITWDSAPVRQAFGRCLVVFDGVVSVASADWKIVRQFRVNVTATTGGRNPMPVLRYMTEAKRGPLLRALEPEIDGCTVIGGTLETSQGATVPLRHAFRVFQLVAYCRANGISWAAERGASDVRHRLPRTIRVGHFRLDSIAPSGDFVAGCHAIKWPEIERLAERLGVSGCLASPAEIAEELAADA